VLPARPRCATSSSATARWSETVRLRSRVRWSLAALALISVWAVTAISAGRAHAGAELAVLGFQSDSDSPSLINANARAMTMVGVDGINLIGPGRVSTPAPVDLVQQAHARAVGLPAVLLIGNWSPRINDFSEPLAHQTLANAATARSAASAVTADVVSEHWDGVSVDLESLAPRDRAGLAEFVSDLHALLPAGDSLTVCLEAFTSSGAYAANGYDLPALAANSDQIVLMTYDDHGPWENTPGPIGPLQWQRASVHALETVVPARQIFLGAANYGYAWRPHANDNLNVSQARALVARWHAHPRWVASVGEWTAKLRDGSTLWWSDRRSVALRLKLARTLGLHGVAVWSLGSGDPLPLS
jgi:spore germination protein